MSIKYGNVTIDTLHYGTTNTDNGYYGSTKVFGGGSSSSPDVVVTASAKVETEQSQIPGPYDSEGYHYGAEAPTRTAEINISLGDVTNYNYIQLDFDMSKSYNSFGTAYAYVSLGSNRTGYLFGSWTYGYTLNTKKARMFIDVSDLTGNQTLRCYAYAKSESPYRGYCSKTVVEFTNVIKTNKSFLTLSSGTVSGNNNTESIYLVMLKDARNKSSLSFQWQNTRANDGYSSFGSGTSIEKAVSSTATLYDEEYCEGVFESLGSITAGSGTLTKDLTFLQSLNPATIATGTNPQIWWKDALVMFFRLKATPNGSSCCTTIYVSNFTIS